MATQRHPAIDSAYPTPVASPITTNVRRRALGTVMRSREDALELQLRLSAEAEARSWKPREKSERIKPFEQSWKAVKGVVNSRLHKATSDLSGREQSLLDNAKLIRQSGG